MGWGGRMRAAACVVCRAQSGPNRGHAGQQGQGPRQPCRSGMWTVGRPVPMPRGSSSSVSNIAMHPPMGSSCRRTARQRGVHRQGREMRRGKGPSMQRSSRCGPRLRKESPCAWHHAHGSGGAASGRTPRQHLRELFSDWTEDELYSAFSETKFDLEQTVSNIADGSTQRWSTVDIKKVKKPAGAASDKPAAPAASAASAGSSGRSGMDWSTPWGAPAHTHMPEKGSPTVGAPTRRPF